MNFISPAQRWRNFKEHLALFLGEAMRADATHAA